jgi:hypothetical protein
VVSGRGLIERARPAAAPRPPLSSPPDKQAGPRARCSRPTSGVSMRTAPGRADRPAPSERRSTPQQRTGEPFACASLVIRNSRHESRRELGGRSGCWISSFALVCSAVASTKRAVTRTRASLRVGVPAAFDAVSRLVWPLAVAGDEDGAQEGASRLREVREPLLDLLLTRAARADERLAQRLQG